MAKGTWKIKLADGTVLDNLTLNGNNFVSPTELTPEMFAGKLAHVTIEGEPDAYGLAGEHGPMELARCCRDDGLGGWAVVLLDIPEDIVKEQARDEEITALQMALVELYEGMVNA